MMLRQIAVEVARARAQENEKEDINTLDDFAKFLNEYYAAPEHKEDGPEIIEELYTLGDDEAIFTDGDSKTPTEWEKVNIHPTEWEYDTHHYCVSVCKK